MGHPDAVRVHCCFCPARRVRGAALSRERPARGSESRAGGRVDLGEKRAPPSGHACQCAARPLWLVGRLPWGALGAASGEEGGTGTKGPTLESCL